MIDKKKNSFLYGDSHTPTKVPQEIIEERVDMLKANLKNLQKVHYLGRDGERCNTILKAIKFWETINEH